MRIFQSKNNKSMATQTMYASGLICGIVCIECEDKPCPFHSWAEKNGCPKIIAYNDRLGQCCATCMHCVAGEYCRQKAGETNVDATTDFSRFLIGEDVFGYSCDKWANTWEEE